MLRSAASGFRPGADLHERAKNRLSSVETGHSLCSANGSAPNLPSVRFAAGRLDAKQLVLSVPTLATRVCWGDRNLRRPHLY